MQEQAKRREKGQKTETGEKMAKFGISRLSEQMFIGDYRATGRTNPNTGKPIKEFVKRNTQPIYFAEIKPTIAEQISIAGSTITDQRLIATRNEFDIKATDKLLINGEIYEIVLISKDKQVNGYNRLTIRRFALKH